MHTARLLLRPFGGQYFDRFVTETLTDPHVVEFDMHLYQLRPADAVIY